MKVKLLVPICGPCGSFTAGSEVDLPEVLASALIKDGHAISLEVFIPEVIIPVIEKEVHIERPRENRQNQQNQQNQQRRKHPQQK